MFHFTFRRKPTLKCTPYELQREIAKEITAAARQLYDPTSGAIVVRFVAKHPSAAKWLGNPETCDYDTNTDVDFVHSLIPGQNKTRDFGCYNTPECPPIAYAGTAMMKLEACARAVVGKHGRCSDSLPDDMVITGCSNTPGAMCFDLIPIGQKSSGKVWLRIYISVDGVSNEESKWCAWHAYPAINSIIGKQSHPAFVLIHPLYDPDAAIESGKVRLDGRKKGTCPIHMKYIPKSTRQRRGETKYPENYTSPLITLPDQLSF